MTGGRVANVLSRARVFAPPAPAPDEPWSCPDLHALYASCDGLELDDGTRILERGLVARTTEWLTTERALAWGDDLIVIGERDDLVVVRDLDRGGVRAGGGVLEAPTDGLETFRRAALDVIGYLEARVGLLDPNPPPEVATRAAIAARDRTGLARAISRPFYPGAQRELAVAARTLGELAAEAGDVEGAMVAFERSVAARVSSARRGAEAEESKSAWRACAASAETAGHAALAEACRARVTGTSRA